MPSTLFPGTLVQGGPVERISLFAMCCTYTAFGGPCERICYPPFGIGPIVALVPDADSFIKCFVHPFPGSNSSRPAPGSNGLAGSRDAPPEFSRFS